MRYIVILTILISFLGKAQVLTTNGMEPIHANTDLTQKENFEKIYTYIKDYVVNEALEITDISANERITVKGKQNNVACYINRKMGSKTCFELQYVMQIQTLDKGFVIDITELDAINEERHPGKNYNIWFDESGNPLPQYASCVTATSDYFIAFKKDFIDYIETGDYW